jgi:DNA-binding transcriptional MocR family regulator
VKQKIHGDSAGSIAASIEHAVHTGSLVAGQTLPTIRELAGSLGVSPVTVAAAYRQLQSRGLVVGEGRRGSRVRPNPPTPLDPVRTLALPDGTTDLATGNPDPEWLPSLDTALRSLSPAAMRYGEGLDFRPLVAFAAAEFAGDGIAARHIAVTHGALDAIERLLREHLRPGDRVGVEDPTLPALVDLLSGSGYLVEPLALDEEGVLPDALAAVATRLRAVVVTPRAQNPTGAAFTSGRAADLRQFLRGHPDLLAIENDAFGPVAGVSVQSVCDGLTRWAVVRTTSKFLGPDLRVAVVAGDDLTIARLRGRQSLGVRWVSHVLQQLALALWSDPASGRRLARAADSYAQRRQALIAALDARGVRVAARSGFNIWIPVREETATVQALAQRGWAVAAGERFRLRSSPGIRVTTSALAAAETPRLAADLAECLRPPRPASA